MGHMELTDEAPDSDLTGPPGGGPDVSFLHGRMEGVLDEPLPRGQHDLPRQFVLQHQRTRIMEAMGHVLHEVGYLDLTVADVVKRARVSRRTFYEHFDDKGHCFTATYGASVECIADAMRDAYANGDAWEDRAAAVFSTLMRLMVEFPATGYVCFVQSGIAGREAERCRTAAVRMSAASFAAMMADGGPDTQITPLQSELAVGALCELVRARIAEGREQDLVDHLPETITDVLIGLVGAERARDVAGRVAVPANAETAKQRAAAP